MYSAIAANKRNTVFIISFFVLIIGGLATWAGYVSGYGSSAFLIIGFVAFYALLQYYLAGSFAVAASAPAPETRAAEISGFKLLWQAFLSWLRGKR